MKIKPTANIFWNLSLRLELFTSFIPIPTYVYFIAVVGAFKTKEDIQSVALSGLICGAYTVIWGLLYRYFKIKNILRDVKLLQEGKINSDKRKEKLKLDILHYPYKEGRTIIARWALGATTGLILFGFLSGQWFPLIPTVSLYLGLLFVLPICYVMYLFSAESVLRSLLLLPEVVSIQVQKEKIHYMGYFRRILLAISAVTIAPITIFGYIIYSIVTGHLSFKDPILHIVLLSFQCIASLVVVAFLSSKLHPTSPIIVSHSILQVKAKKDCESFINRCFELSGVKFFLTQGSYTIPCRVYRRKQMASENIAEINTQEYESIAKQEGTYILDFYSDECAPCESLAPKYQEMANLFGDKVKFYKIFRQQNRELAKELGVSSSPTVIFFQDGKETGYRLIGGIKKKDLLTNIETLVPSDEFKNRLNNKKPITKEADVLILGGGPAGMSAGIYAAQAKLKTIMVDPELTGGQVKTTHLISNYAGTGKAVNGYELMDLMLTQTKEAGVDVIAAVDLTELQLSEDGGMHKLVIDGGDLTIHAKSLIITTGAQPRMTGAPGEKENRGLGISYCATCDGKYYDEKEIVVVGGGNSAVEESLFLTRFATKIRMIQNLDVLTANKTAVDHLLKNEKISVTYNTVVKEFIRLEDGRMKLILSNTKTGEESVMETDGVFVFIGMIPNTEILPKSLKADNWGYLISNDDMETNIPGVYAAGDVRSKKIRQAATAVGDGAIAGILVEKYVELFDARVKGNH